MPVLKYRPDESSSWQTVGITADGYTKAETDTLLAGKAPAGFGLGGQSKFISSSDDLNDVINDGWYYFDAPPINAPLLDSVNAVGYSSMLVSNRFPSLYVTQEIFCYNSWEAFNCVLRRCRINGEWKPWEWVNPPMLSGEEYRTTERYQGKPVYAKAVSIDGLPNNGIKTFPWSDSYVNRPFFVTGFAMRSEGGSYMSLPTDVYYSLSGSPMSGRISISAIEKQIIIKTDFDATSFDTVTVCVKYTKTTD